MEFPCQYIGRESARPRPASWAGPLDPTHHPRSPSQYHRVEDLASALEVALVTGISPLPELGGDGRYGVSPTDSPRSFPSRCLSTSKASSHRPRRAQGAWSKSEMCAAGSG